MNKQTPREKLKSVYKMLRRQNKVVENLKKTKDRGYRERNQVVAALSKLFKSHISKDLNPAQGLPKDSRHVVYIELPSGQVSWHISDDEISEFFSHLEIKESQEWDGHTTDEKYERLKNIAGYSITLEYPRPYCYDRHGICETDEVCYCNRQLCPNKQCEQLLSSMLGTEEIINCHHCDAQITIIK